MDKKISLDFKKDLSSNFFLRILQVCDISYKYINRLNSNEIMQYTEQTRTLHNKENVTTIRRTRRK